jgi:hypothetical protein
LLRLLRRLGPAIALVGLVWLPLGSSGFSMNVSELHCEPVAERTMALLQAMGAWSERLVFFASATTAHA